MPISTTIRMRRSMTMTDLFRWLAWWLPWTLGMIVLVWLVVRPFKRFLRKLKIEREYDMTDQL